MAAQHRPEDAVKTYIYVSSLSFQKGYRTMASGWPGAPCFRRYDEELVSKPAISLKNRWGGYRRTALYTGNNSYVGMVDRGT